MRVMYRDGLLSLKYTITLQYLNDKIRSNKILLEDYKLLARTILSTVGYADPWVDHVGSQREKRFESERQKLSKAFRLLHKAYKEVFFTKRREIEQAIARVLPRLHKKSAGPTVNTVDHVVYLLMYQRL